MKNRIKELRQQKNMTTLDLSRELGISHQILAEYEMGILPLTDEVLLKLAEHFDVPVGYILYAK